MKLTLVAKNWSLDLPRRYYVDLYKYLLNVDLEGSSHILYIITHYKEDGEHATSVRRHESVEKVVMGGG
jgi:hypothetical protein